MSILKEPVVPDGYRSLSSEELTELLHDDDKMDRIIRMNEKFQELQVEHESLLSSNRTLAEESLARQPRLNHGKVQLAEKYRELSCLAKVCNGKQSRMETGVHSRSLQTAQTLLQEEVTRAEDQSEELLEKFMEGHLSLDNFLDTFQSSRKMYHIRRAQAEKMQEAAVKEGRQTGKLSKEEVQEEKKDSDSVQDPQRPNGIVAQGPLRVFQVRYGLTPAILLPHYPVSLPSAPNLQSSNHPPDRPVGQTHILSPTSQMPAHSAPVGLRVIGQLPGSWAAAGRPVRVQQLYRPNQPEPPFR